MSNKNWIIRSSWYLLAVFISILALSGSFGSVKATSLGTGLQTGVAPTSVTIVRVSPGKINQSTTFTAVVSPETASTPITFTWTVIKDNGFEDTPVVHADVNSLADSLSYTWQTGGFKYILVTAANASGSINEVIYFPVEVPAFLYPPYPTSNPFIMSVFDHDQPLYDGDPNHNSVLTWRGELYSGAWNGDTFNDLNYPGHAGIDYTVGYLPIYAAAASNQVLHAGWVRPEDHTVGLGLRVELVHENGYHTVYGHLSSISVKSCTQTYCPIITQGKFVGIGGDTGASTGPHLHFEVRSPFNYQDNPAKFIPVDPYGYDPIENPDYELPEWRFTQPNSLWVEPPAISGQPPHLGTNSYFPVGTTVLNLPASPNGGVVVDDYAHLSTNNAPNFTTTGTGSATDCWAIEPKLNLMAGYAENNYNLIADAVLGTSEDDKGTCWVKWFLPPDQPTGEYGIYIRIPRDNDDDYADNVLYRVYRAGNQIAKINISQYSINNTVLRGDTYSHDPTVDAGWVYIGNYYFAQGATNYVELTDKVFGDTINVANSTEVGSPKVAVDAVKFIRATSSQNVDAVLVIDSSSSMGWNDPDNKRLTASRLFTTRAVEGDYVGIVDFDGSVRVATNPPLQRLHENDASVIAAINTINSSGSTNIGIGLQKGCDLLSQSERTDYRKGAILLTDGDGGFSGQDACFIEKGWPVFTFGFGDAVDSLLQQIASNTGGRYTRITNLDSLTCEFIRVRTLIANAEPGPCLPYNVPPFGSVAFAQTVAPGQEQATFSASWPGSDVVMTLTSPTGRVIDRNTVAPDVNHENGTTYEVYTILNPEPGSWNVNLYGASVPSGGEETIFGFASIPAPEPPTAPPIFADGFESGDFSNWWWFDANSNLTVSTQAAAVGSYGMKAVITKASTLMVYDDSPVDQKHYSARFYFNPNSINIPNGQGTYLFAGSDNIGWIMCLYMKHIGQSYLLNVCGHNDAGNWLESDGTYINNAWTEVELEWQSATAPGANNGFFKLWINDSFVDSIENIDSDTLFIKDVSLGVSSQPSTTTGSIYFDAFESTAGSHIGLDANGPVLSPLPTPPDAIFAEGFESNTLNAWHWAETNSGNLSTSTQSHGVGSYGMQVVFSNTNNMNVYDNTPRNEKHYDARFYFNPNSVNLPNGQGMYVFAGSDAHWAFCLYMERRGGYYRLSLCGEDNDRKWIESRYVYISNDWQAIEVEWQAASSPGANNGYMKLFINDVLASDIENLNNDTRFITEVNLGASTIPSGTTGTVYFDAFESRRNTHIGLDPNGPSRSPVSTSWISPASNAAVTSSAGDNNGFQTTPTNAYADGGGFSVDTDSGSNTSTSCTDAGKDRHVYYTYGLSSIPSGSSVVGIEVRLDLKADSTTGSPKTCVQLSWDGGVTWSAAKATKTLSTSEATYTLGSASDTWGHTWTTNELSTLRVRVTDVSSSTTSDFSLDWIPLRVTYLPPVPPLTLIFTDGFETGNLLSWNNVVSGNGKLSASTASAMFGSYGMQAAITDTTDLYVEDWSPVNETHYGARFYLNPHSISIPNGGSFYILSNNNLRVLLKNNAGTYQLRADIYKEDTNSWVTGSFVNITNSRTLVEVEWQAASSAQVHDGYLKFWINDALAYTLANVDNDKQAITFIDLGVMWSIPAGTSGTVYFDSFESRYSGHIGP